MPNWCINNLVIETDNKSIKDVQKEAIKHIKSSNEL